MQVVVLAGGLGTRIARDAGNKPKALIEVNGLPFLEHQRRWIESSGATEIVYSVGHRGDQIEEYLNHIVTTVCLKVVREPQPLGTGGALRFLYDAGALQDRFLLLYGDSYLRVSLEEVWRRFLGDDAPALMTVYKNFGAFDRSNARVAGNRVAFYSKQDHGGGSLDYIDYGLSALSREDVAGWFVPGQAADLAPYLSKRAVEGQLAAMEVFERFYEIGSPAGLAEFRAFAKCHLTEPSGHC